MNNNRVTEIFKQIELLLDELKSAYTGSVKVPVTLLKTKSSAKGRKSKKGTGPAKSILDLEAQDFFNTHKTVGETQLELKKRAFNINADSLSVALMRLVRKGVLEREGLGTKKDPYKYKSK